MKSLKPIHNQNEDMEFAIYNTVQVDKFLVDHEKILFSYENNKDLVNVVYYELKNDKKTDEQMEKNLNEPNQVPTVPKYIYKVPNPVFKTIDILAQNPTFSIWSNFKNSNNKYYCKKWIYQIIHGIYEIHVIRNSYIGFLSDESITIDKNLNAKIEFLGYISNSLLCQFFYFSEPSRMKNRDDIFKYSDSEDDFKKYDIYALGILIQEILNFDTAKINKAPELVYKELEKGERYKENVDNQNNQNDNDQNNNDQNNDNQNDNDQNNDNQNGNDQNGDEVNDIDNSVHSDEEFSRIIANEIINLCLSPLDERPTIDTISKKITQIYNDLEIFDEFNSKLNSTNFDPHLHDIFNKLNQAPNLIRCFRDSDNLKPDYFKLNDSCQFEFYFNDEDHYFHTIPSVVDDKFYDEFYSSFLFSNLYFCNLRDLFKVYTPIKGNMIYEICFWALCLSDFISNMHQKNDFLPPNFTIENILVSFMAVDIPNIFARDAQIQLSIFPYEIKNSPNSDSYICPNPKSNVEKDVYSFGILILEILYKYITNDFLFSVVESKEIDTKEKLEKKIKDDIPSEWFNLIANCLFSYNNRTFKSIHDDINKIIKSYDPKQTKKGIELFNYWKKYPQMDSKRFSNLFKCYSKYEKSNLLIIFNNRINCLCNGFISDSLFFDPKLISAYIDSYESYCNENNNNKDQACIEEEEEENDEDDEKSINLKVISYTDFVHSKYIPTVKFDKITIDEEASSQYFEDFDKRTARQTLSILSRKPGFIYLQVINNDPSDESLATMEDVKLMCQKLAIPYEEVPFGMQEKRLLLHIMPLFEFPFIIKNPIVITSNMKLTNFKLSTKFDPKVIDLPKSSNTIYDVEFHFKNDDYFESPVIVTVSSMTDEIPLSFQMTPKKAGNCELNIFCYYTTETGNEARSLMDPLKLTIDMFLSPLDESMIKLIPENTQKLTRVLLYPFSEFKNKFLTNGFGKYAIITENKMEAKLMTPDSHLVLFEATGNEDETNVIFTSDSDELLSSISDFLECNFTIK